MPARLALTRAQILAFRHHVGLLDKRRPATAASLRRAAWAGLQDSMPRSALLSIHARLEKTQPDTWQHSSLIQLWGPRFHNYIVSGKDRPVFTLGRLPQAGGRRDRAFKIAAQLHAFLGRRKMPFGQAGRAIGLPPNSLRYAALTGTTQLHWDGSRQPLIWTVSEPSMDPRRARLELARRYLHVFGPSTVESFARWAGLSAKQAHATFETLASELTFARTPIGDALMLTADEAALRTRRPALTGARLLPSGDAYYLLWGADRAMLIPDARRRAALWTARVWPGALLVGGEIIGTWRRTGTSISIDQWRQFTRPERTAVETEAALLPLRTQALI